MTHRQPIAAQTSRSHDRAGRAAFWSGLVVALGAAAATAHGLYEVAEAAGVPIAVAVLYPLITDGLALVAYAATSRLRTSARLYAWLVVVLAAGLSGLAQAVYLAGGLATAGTALRFGVGAWPAVAAAIAAHLIHLLARAHMPDEVDATDEAAARNSPTSSVVTGTPRADITVGVDVSSRVVPVPVDAAQVIQPVHSGVQPVRVQGVVQPSSAHDVQPVQVPDGQPPLPFEAEPMSVLAATVAEPVGHVPALDKPGDRARAAARRHHRRHGDWPTARELAEAADVSTGTAGNVLKALRDSSDRLHLVPDEADAKASR